MTRYRPARAPGDTTVWEVLTIPNNPGFYMPGYAADINYFFAHIAADGGQAYR